MKNALLVGTVMLAMSAAPAFARSKSGKTTAKTTTDQTFVKKAAEGGLAEVQLADLAKQKASNPEVKQFADRMATDHGKANDELKSLAQTKNSTLPSDLSAKDKALRDRLSKLSGEQFDRAYMQAMVKDHTHDVNEFRHESQAAKDPDVKAFAAKTLPTLEQHLQLAQQDAKAVGTSGAKATTGAKSTRKPGK